MSLYKGDIVLVPFPFTNLLQSKVRPAVVLWSDTSSSDTMLCFISSQNTDSLRPGDLSIKPDDPEFTGTGLRVKSKVRVTRIATVERSLIQRRLGNLGQDQLARLNDVLIQVLQLHDSSST